MYRNSANLLLAIILSDCIDTTCSDQHYQYNAFVFIISESVKARQFAWLLIVFGVLLEETCNNRILYSMIFVKVHQIYQFRANLNQYWILL